MPDNPFDTPLTLDSLKQYWWFVAIIAGIVGNGVSVNYQLQELQKQNIEILSVVKDEQKTISADKERIIALEKDVAILQTKEKKEQ